MQKRNKLKSGILFGLVVFVIMFANTWAEGELTDPYEIFERHLDAIGGFEKVKAEITSYLETEIEVAGLQGTIKAWSMFPIYERQDIDLKIFTQSTGDNGEYKWSTDANGKLQIHKDEDLLIRRELQKLTAEYENLNRNSSTFVLIYNGMEKVGEIDCYVVKTTNNINTDSSLTFFNMSNFLIEKSISYTPDSESHTLYTDYRDVQGLLRSFHQEVLTLPTNQEVSVQITKYESNIEIDHALFEPPGEDVRDFLFTEGNSVEDVPFEYIFGHIFLKVNVGCKEKLWFLDSGAGMSVIDSSFADELDLDTDGDLKAKGAGNTVSFSFVKLPPFSLKGIQFEEQTIGSINLKNLLQKTGLEAVGVLGYDFMSRFVTKIDYANKTISFYDPETFEYSGDGKILDAPVKGSLLSVPATIDGKYTGRFRLDLGAGGNAIHYPFAKENGLLDKEGVGGISLGAGGEMYSKSAQFNSMEIAGFSVDKPVIEIPQDDLAGGFGDTELIGNIGNSFLRHFTIFLDYERQQLIVEKGDNYQREFSKGKSGVQIMYDEDNNFEVIYVAKNTPGSKAGFKKGDIVLAINDIDVDNFNGLTAIRQLWRADVGTEYKFVVLRDGDKKNLKLILENIY
jgi:PDZ domain/Aspartyl protease